jgi:hypothetical protein
MREPEADYSRFLGFASQLPSAPWLRNVFSKRKSEFARVIFNRAAIIVVDDGYIPQAFFCVLKINTFRFCRDRSLRLTMPLAMNAGLVRSRDYSGLTRAEMSEKGSLWQ